MSTIFALAGLSAADYQFIRQVDNAILYEAVALYVAQANNAFMGAAASFVMTDTEKAKERYQLPMTGRMQRKSKQSKAKAVTRRGKIDVEYPLEMFGDDLVTTRVDFAYTTGEEFQSYIDGILSRANAAQRHEILRRLFNNTNFSFQDERLGTLTLIKPLANGDSDVYPPVLGEDTTEATDDHYKVSGYTTANISDTNNPIRTAVNEIDEHFNQLTGGNPFVTFINSAEELAISSLTNFVEWTPNGIATGDNTDTVEQPLRPVPGRIIGKVSDSWISVWAWIPATYTVTIRQDLDAPLKRRVDTSESGLADRGVLVNTGSFSNYPLTFNEWTLRFGYGTANRLNGVITQMKASGSYDIPSAYS
jgi:hypothetical protein